METRRSYPLLLTLTLSVATLVALMLFANHTVVALATPRYVATSGVDSGTCDVPSNPCATVQYAVDQADAGDSIRVAEGRYAGVLTRPAPAGYDGVPASGVVTQVVYLTKTVHIEGGFTAPLFAFPPDPAANPTTLDAESNGRVILVADSASPTFRGLTITGGDATGLGGDGFGNDVGGGIHIDTTTVAITGTRVISNTAENGGGVYSSYSDLTLYQSEILSNTASSGAGGIHAQSGPANKLVGNIIAHNRGRSSGGITLGYSPGELLDNVFWSNTATSTGGGIRLFRSVGTTLDGNIIAGNSAANGGGMLIEYESQANLINTVLTNNQATGIGNGIHVERSNVTLLHSTISDHRQGSGVGIYANDLASTYSTVLMTNTILVSNTVGIHAEAGNTATLEATLWHGNGTDTSGAGSFTLIAPNVYEPPGFSDPNGTGFHLALGSAAIDAGVDAGVTGDIDGHRRPIGAGFDLGADEGPWVVYLPLVRRANP